jgi:hypothetical protein
MQPRVFGNLACNWINICGCAVDCVYRILRPYRLHGGSSIALIRATEVSAQPVPIASGTTPLWMCRVRVSRGFPPRVR